MGKTNYLLMNVLHIISKKDNDRNCKDNLIYVWTYEESEVKECQNTINDNCIRKEAIEELLLEIPLEEAAHSHKIKETDYRSDSRRVKKEYEMSKSTNEIKTFFSFIIAKNKGIYAGKVEEFDIYDFNTDKGKVRLFITLKDNVDATHIIIIYEGSQEAIEKISNEIEKEINVLGGIIW